MLKRLSEAISQSNIESESLASEIYCPNHSSCNFSPKQNVEQKLEPSRELSLEDVRSWNSRGTRAGLSSQTPSSPVPGALHNRVNGGKQRLKTY